MTVNGQKWEQRFEINGTVKCYYPKSKEVMEKNLRIAREKGYKVIASHKLYPFNMARYGHNIELAYNHQSIICYEMRDGERPWDDKAFDYFEELGEAYGKAMGQGPIAWLDGKTYGIIRDASVWAECYRDSHQCR